MHLAGALAGSSSASGTLTGIFSGIQIAAGILLGVITARLKKFTAGAAMLSFALGAVLLALFPGNFPMLALSSVLCGMSQGVFIPTAATYLSNHVAPVATALASATLTVAMNIGQLLSPVVLNAVCMKIFGQTTTTGVYTISACGMAVCAAAMCAWRHFSED